MADGMQPMLGASRRYLTRALIRGMAPLGMPIARRAFPKWSRTGPWASSSQAFASRKCLRQTGTVASFLRKRNPSTSPTAGSASRMHIFILTMIHTPWVYKAMAGV